MKKGKKLLVALLAGALAVATMAAFAACGNSHTWSENWSSDATSHWHACTDEGCTEVSDKADHTFDEGEEAKAATYNSEGEKVYTCTVCGYEKKESVAALEKTGTALLAAKSTMVDQNNSTLPITTTLSIDFESKEAVLNVVASVDVGGGYIMEFCFVTDEKDPDLEASNPMYYMSVMEIGKGTLTSTGVGTYSLTWGSGDTEMVVPVTLNAAGECSATVQVTGVHAEALELDDVTELATGTVTMSGSGTLTDENQTQLPVAMTFDVDFTNNEAVLNLVASVDVGGGYIMEFCFITDAKDPDLEAENPMYYMSVMEIGKATVVRTGAYTYTATWQLTDATNGTSSDYVVTITVDEDGVCTASDTFIVCDSAVSITSAVQAAE